MMPIADATFTRGVIARHILVMTSTSALSLFAVFLVDILTLVYVAMLHDPSLLAAVGIAKVLIFLNAAFSNGLIIAAATVLSRRLGHCAITAVARLAHSLMLMVVVVSGLSAALQLAFVWPLAHWLGADAITYELARSFIWLTLPFTVLHAAMQMSAQILRTLGDSRKALIVVLSAAATLAVCDPLFIFVLDLGLNGAGIAYGVSACVSVSLGAYWVRRSVGAPGRLSGRLLRVHVARTFRIAFPASVANLATPVGLAYVVSAVGAYGTTALAAMAVLDRVIQFSYCAFFSLPAALTPVLGQNIGARLDHRVQSAITFSRRLVVVYGLTIWAILLLSCNEIADFYQLEGEGRALFLSFCRYGGGFWVLIGLDFVAISQFVTMGRTWLVAVFAWLRVTVGTMPFVLAGSHLFGSSGTLSGMFAGNACIAAVSIFTAALTAKRFFYRRASLER